MDRETASTIERLSAFGVSTIYEAQGGGALPTDIKTVNRGLKMCGVAFTIVCGPRDNLMLHHAASTAEAGHVLIADAGGNLETGIWGDVLATAAIARGIRGLVVNGAVRDAETLADMKFPVFARGVCMKGGTKRLRGEAQVALHFGDVSVAPGDYIVGDDDGVVRVSRANVERVLEAAASREAKEDTFRSRLRAGATTVELFELSTLLNAAPLAAKT